MKAKPKRRIGFVDYDLENYHAKTYLSILRNQLAGRGFVVSGCTAMRKRKGEAWARKSGVPFFDSARELNQSVDFFVILAPGNPETHLALCREVLPFGKTTFVDKTFAPDLKTARQIFALADKHKVKTQTTSALRYTEVQEYAAGIGRNKIVTMTAWGGGSSFGEYAIHPVEMLISCMGPDVESLMRRQSGNVAQLLLNFSRGRTGVVNVCVKSNTPYSASVAGREETKTFLVDGSQLFVNAAAAILDFFESGRQVIGRRETLMVRRILDVAESPGALRRFVRV